MTTNEKTLIMKLHDETHNMTTYQAGKWTKEKVKALGEHLIALSENNELTHDDLIAYVERINALVKNNADKAHSDAGWDYENARNSYDENRHNHWESMGT